MVPYLLLQYFRAYFSSLLYLLPRFNVTDTGVNEHDSTVVFSRTNATA